MSLPAFSAIIANYVPNHGNIGPSGSYNAWVNKINTRKNACNSWATCTNTPDDIWNEKFTECDEGCSAQGDDKCVSNFCDALADVYDYTRRLESSDNRRLTDTTPTVHWYTGKGKYEALSASYNTWVHHLNTAKFANKISSANLNMEFTDCPNGCVSASGVCSEGSNFCAALVAVFNGVTDGSRNGYKPEDTPIKELGEAYSPGVELTQSNKDWRVCSMGSLDGTDCDIEQLCQEAFPGKCYNAFSATIGSYFNPGAPLPEPDDSRSYNQWINKINNRKNSCNSGAATCTSGTPYDLWDMPFWDKWTPSSDCECSATGGCSSKCLCTCSATEGVDRCDTTFCRALAAVYTLV